eukprot:6231333-Ditylum_brightwellii.AAC.1
MERSKQNEHVVCNKDNDVDDGDDDSNDSADKHLTHLTQVKNNGNHDVCDITLTHVVKNTPTSLKSDVTLLCHKAQQHIAFYLQHNADHFP